MSRAAVLTSVLLYSLWPNTSYPEIPTTAVTVDVHDGAFAGHAAGITVMNVPCVYGDRYHYEINSEGVLRVLGPIICGNSKGNSSGGEEICYLNPQLSCQSRTGFSAGAGAPYAINESGVKVGNKVVPWVDPPQAIALMPSIQERAKAQCDSVLFWQAKEKEHNKTTSIPAKMDAQEGCKPTLAQICASSGGKLANGKDVSILCRP
jgi:hypothetical protein